MKAALKLEVFGDDTVAYCKLAREHFRSVLPRELADQMLGGIPGPGVWVAELTGKDPRFGYARRFLRGAKDYREANSVGSRGVHLWFTLEEGPVYEVKERTSWKRSRRYFCRVRGGQVEEISGDEVASCLNARSA